MDNTITSLDKTKICVDKSKNFVLEGGAGSGKTETLKQVLQYINTTYPEKKVVCVTHTNAAVAEIESRVGNGYLISTIHSFLNSLIKNYKKNIHSIISDLFVLETIDRKSVEHYSDEKEQKKKEFDKYKRIYNKYAKELYSLNKEIVREHLGKRVYDTTFVQENEELNNKIQSLNETIIELINKENYSSIKYNETKYNNLNGLTYGHDGLLKITHLLFKFFPLLGKIISDRYDYILIDEYQDTSEQIIDLFIDIASKNKSITLGLFGDSMQGIYDDGVGDVEIFLKEGKLNRILKEDNFRCSEQVINFINEIRLDDLEQNVAFKKNETIENRQGSVKLYYSIQPDSISKEEYLNNLAQIISKIESKNPNYRKLMLTNRSISEKVGFSNLFNIFSSRYSDTANEEIEKKLDNLQFKKLAELCAGFNNKEYNFLISELKKSGLIINSIKDKIQITKLFDELIEDKFSSFEAIEFAFDNKILKKQNSYDFYISRKDDFLKNISDNSNYQSLKKIYNSGHNTLRKIQKQNIEISREEFLEFKNIVKKENFYNDLFSDKISFHEILKYFSYLNENEEYITMHKTKGSDIENVFVILDEYSFTKYNFGLLFDSNIEATKVAVQNRSQKLFYVACSRTVNNLVILRITSEDEVTSLKNYFKGTEIISYKLDTDEFIHQEGN